MAQKIADIFVEIGVRFSGMTKGIKGAQNSLNGLDNSVKKVGKSLISVGKILVTGWIGKKIFNITKNFETSLVKLGQVANIQGQELIALGKDAQIIGQQFGTSSKDVVDGLSSMSKAGFSAQKSLHLLPTILKISKISGADFAKTLGLLESAMKEFQLTEADTNRVADVFTTVQKNARISIDNLQSSLVYVGSNAFKANQSIEDLTGALGILAERGRKGSSAGTGLSEVFKNLATPSKKAAKMIAQLGINVFTTSGKMKPILTIVKEFQNKLKKLTSKQKNFALATIFGERAVRAFGDLLSATPQEIDKMTSALKNAEGATNTFWNAVSSTTQEKLNRIKAGLENFALNVGQVLAPFLDPVLDAVERFIEKLKDPAYQDFIRTLLSIGLGIGTVIGILFGFVKAVAGIEEVIISFGKLRKAIGQLRLFILFLVGAENIAIIKMNILTALNYAYAAASGIATAATWLLNAAFAVLTSPITLIILAIGTVIATLIHLWKTNENFRNAVIKALNAVVNAFQSAKTSIYNFLSNIGTYMSNFIIKAFTWGKDMFKKFGDGLVAGFKWVQGKIISAANWIKSKLGFSVPDSGPLSDANKWMPDFMNLLAHGIEMGIPKLQMAVGDISSTLDLGSDLGGSRTTNINVYPRQANLDAHGLNRELQRMQWLNGGVF